MAEVTPYRVEIPEADLDDLRDRLRRTRWPDRETVSDWSQGIPSEYLRDLCSYWEREYDWRALERRLNAFNQLKVHVGGLGVHVLHVTSPHPGAVPLVMTHGWPGSVVEFLNVIGPLTDPVAHGGSAADAFHLVMPSLPGYGFSDKPTGTGWGVPRIADAWAELMTALGYDQYAVQGGDWGARVSTELAIRHPDAVLGLHLTLPLVDVRAATAELGELDERDTASLATHRRFRWEEAGYSTQQSTRPQTVGYGLVDSPAALAGWIVEKFHGWTDCDGHPEKILTRDQLLDNVMMYWLPAAGASAARLYWESFRSRPQGVVTVPTGCSLFPRELFRLSRSLVETRFRDLRYWSEPDRGGHFAAFEQPALFVDELRAFFRLLPPRVACDDVPGGPR
ncbi:MULTISPECIES: epoxide hydrolase family protein [Protofrankia]|uniref:Epoxide hydrolase n=1 Tax=Protofrankia coriariae TaxID=1562887 RepID=A0ABR5EZY1_9ACTN|nr:MULTISPECIES: epoxide hydrolase family protein [Protofrankia]KLL10027.1 epoxide hydrolase [Protofrankia coriariae]ONH33448.1 epoxide hydrolase [Protofrankia sp. BMG5.30]